jgi:acyltransferase
VSAFARPLQPTVARAPLRAAARVDWVDGARAIGILLVMVGHLQALPTWLGQLIFSLHVPLFFWLSGWLCDPAAGAGSARTGVGTTLRRLAVPYALFFGLSWAYWMLTRGHPSRSVDHGALHWSEPWVGFVLGIGPQMIVNPTLWFFPCLIATTILFGLLARSAARLGAGSAAATAAIAVLAAALLAILPAPSARWPWGLDIVPSALLLFALGHACRIVWPVLAPGSAWRRRSAGASLRPHGARPRSPAGRSIFRPWRTAVRRGRSSSWRCSASPRCSELRITCRWDRRCVGCRATR